MSSALHTEDLADLTYVHDVILIGACDLLMLSFRYCRYFAGILYIPFDSDKKVAVIEKMQHSVLSVRRCLQSR
jgi:hypothetical protein